MNILWCVVTWFFTIGVLVGFSNWFLLVVGLSFLFGYRFVPDFAKYGGVAFLAFLIGVGRGFAEESLFDFGFVESSVVFRLAEDLQRAISYQVDILFLQPYAGFLKGILLGIGSSISKTLLQDFRMTGLSHTLVVSGYNIAILVVFFWKALFFVQRKNRVLWSFGGVVFFVLLSGISASSLRAAFMGGISLLALYFGRTYASVPSICFSFLVMNFLDRGLLFDISFQLSFGATIGVLYVSPVFVQLFRFLPETFSLRENFSLTVSAQITTMPFVIYHFGLVSLIAPVANIFVLPFIPFFMMFGCIAVLISFVFPFLAGMIAFVLMWMMKILFGLVALLAKVPFATI